MSVEVKVTRTVPDSVWTEALRDLYTDLVYQAAAYADSYAPHDRGDLAQSLQPQDAIVVDGGALPQWARYKPKIGNPPYPGYLNAGSYTRTWVPPRTAIGKWAGKKGFDAEKTAGVYGGMLRRRPKVVHYHYVNQPRAAPPNTTSDQYGRLTKGWFNPSVVTAMEKGGDAQRAVDDFAAAIERAWSG